MTIAQFKETLLEEHPPPGMQDLLKSLWFQGKDNWEQAHNIAQTIPTPKGSWVHAFLHRVEGDLGNAGYWYSRAGKKMPPYSTAQEWEELVQYFLNRPV